MALAIGLGQPVMAGSVALCGWLGTTAWIVRVVPRLRMGPAVLTRGSRVSLVLAFLFAIMAGAVVVWGVAIGLQPAHRVDASFDVISSSLGPWSAPIAAVFVVVAIASGLGAATARQAWTRARSLAHG